MSIDIIFIFQIMYTWYRFKALFFYLLGVVLIFILIFRVFLDFINLFIFIFYIFIWLSFLSWITLFWIWILFEKKLLKNIKNIKYNSNNHNYKLTQNKCKINLLRVYDLFYLVSSNNIWAILYKFNFLFDY